MWEAAATERATWHGATVMALSNPRATGWRKLRRREQTADLKLLAGGPGLPSLKCTSAAAPT